MNPNQQSKIRRKAQKTIDTFSPETENEEYLFKQINALLNCLDDLEFEKARLEKQAHHWKDQCQTALENLKALKKEIRKSVQEYKVQIKEKERKAAEKERERIKKEKEKICEENKKLQQAAAELKNKSQEERAILEEQARNDLMKYREEKENMQKQMQEVNGKLEQAQGRIHILEKSLKSDSYNSSRPSSTDGFKKGKRRIPNNRDKSGRKPGGRSGHPSTKKELIAPDNVFVLDDTKFLQDPERYLNTGKKKVKQLHRIRFVFTVDQVEGGIFYDRQEHRQVTAEFPPGMHSEITYHSSVISFAMLLHTWCHVSYDRIALFLSDLTGEKLKIAKSTLASFETRFQQKTSQDRDQITADLLLHPFLHVDGTTIIVNGKQMCELVITSPAGTRYYFSEHKGNEAAEKTFLKYYLGVLVHDAEATFFKYGKEHQCCCEHEIRYLRGISESEPEIKWAAGMRETIQEMIHLAHCALEKGKNALDEKEAERLLRDYDKWIETGRREYKENSKLVRYSDGPAVLNRLEKNKGNLTYFLNHLEINATNSAAEVALRKEKMHCKQNGGYRSAKAAESHCDSMSVLESSRQRKENVYAKINSVFDTGVDEVLNAHRKRAA